MGVVFFWGGGGVGSCERRMCMFLGNIICSISQLNNVLLCGFYCIMKVEGQCSSSSSTFKITKLALAIKLQLQNKVA